MKRAWAATALLAGWWLFGLGCFYPAGLPACVLILALGVVLLKDLPLRLPGRSECAAVSVLLLPVVWWVPWPWRTAPLVLWTGVLLGWLARPVQEATSWGLSRADGLRGSDQPGKAGLGAAFLRLARALVAAGCVLVVQAGVVWSYFALTARTHDLPRAFAGLLGALVRLTGVKTAVDGPYLVMHTVRQTHRLAATWELLADPATAGFLAGGLVLLALAVRGRTGPAGRELHDREQPQGLKQRDRSLQAHASHDRKSQGLEPQGRESHSRLRRWAAAAGTLALVVAAWLPVRAALLVAVYLHRAVRADAALPLNVMNHFFSPWVLTALLGVPAGLAAAFVRLRAYAPADCRDGAPASAAEQKLAGADQGATSARRERAAEGASGLLAGLKAHRRLGARGALFGLAGMLAAVGLWLEPVGERKSGRVMFVERHSEWEPSDHPYDTEAYGEMASYNYKAAYDYLGQYYRMSRLLESERIDDRRLAECDVLVIKTPTARYSREEVEAVLRFVRRGGGLLFVGDHTNYERSSTYMNDIARHLGFSFRNDLLFGFEGSPYEQTYRPRGLVHPALQHLPDTDFAVSCSVDPGWSRGRAALRSLGLWSMPPEYHIENFHPFPQHYPQVRYGAFIQVWETRYGRGRVMAFTDSTIFSNFCIFQPGKAELLRGMIEWLNHNGTRTAAWVALLLTLLPAGAGIWLAAKRPSDAAARESADAWLVLASAVLCGGVLGGAAAGWWTRRQMPVPEVQRPLPCVVVDRTTSEVPLSKGAYTQGDGQGYGLLEQWIARLGYVTARRTGAEAFEGDALVVLCPSRSVSAEFREQLVRYVAAGGRLLVIDSPENDASTANSLLWPFGLSFERDQPWNGRLTVTSDPWAGRPALAGNWPDFNVEQAWSIHGGEPLARIGIKPVAAAKRHGKGLVMAVGFGSAFNDTNMGSNWMTVPDAALRRRFDTLFSLLRYLVEDRPIARPLAAPSAPGTLDSSTLPGALPPPPGVLTPPD